MAKTKLIIDRITEIENEVKAKPRDTFEAIDRQVKCLKMLTEIKTELKNLIECN